MKSCLVFLGAVALGIGGCAATDVVVANLGVDGAGHDGGDDGGDAGGLAGPDVGPPPPGPPCRSNNECAPNAFCAKSACGDPIGGCEQRPAICDATSAAVCGCDGVTYWNDCLRKRDGVAVGEPGACAVGAACTDPAGVTCPVSDASCARLVYGPQSCPTSFAGVCWVLPDACPSPSPPGPMWRACAPPDDCTDVCSAIRLGTPHHVAPPPGTCP